MADRFGTDEVTLSGGGGGRVEDAIFALYGSEGEGGVFVAFSFAMGLTIFSSSNSFSKAS